MVDVNNDQTIVVLLFGFNTDTVSAIFRILCPMIYTHNEGLFRGLMGFKVSPALSRQEMKVVRRPTLGEVSVNARLLVHILHETAVCQREQLFENDASPSGRVWEGIPIEGIVKALTDNVLLQDEGAALDLDQR